MEIDVTRALLEMAPADYSASVAEIGADAARATWTAAVTDAPDLLRECYDRDAFIEFFHSFGAWTNDELAAQSDAENMALMLQFIAGDVRDADFIDAERFSNEWWQQYGIAAFNGRIACRLFRNDDGRVYYDIGS